MLDQTSRGGGRGHAVNKRSGVGRGGWTGAGVTLVAASLVFGFGMDAPPRGTTEDAAQPDASKPNAAPAARERYEEPIPGAAFRVEMVKIPGSADGRIKAFWMSATEVGWEAFDVFVYRLDEEAGLGEVDAVTRPSKPYLPPDRGFGHEGYAAISMSHKNAAEFCVWLSKKTGRTYRLATEDEWEHACLAGATTAYAFGDDASGLGEFAWFKANADGTPHPRGKKQPNAWGLYDMHGNVAEWVSGRDGQPVIKGGSYRDEAPALTAKARRAQEASWNASDPQIPKSAWWLSDGPFVGFRIVCEVAAGAEGASKNGATTTTKPGGS